MSTRTEPAPQFARLQVELVVQITDPRALVAAALDQVAGDEYLSDGERDRATAAIREDETEALAFLIDPYDLVNGVPGVELARASWSCGHTEYDPAAADAESWAFGEEEEGGNGGTERRAERPQEGGQPESWGGGAWEGSGADQPGPP